MKNATKKNNSLTVFFKKLPQMLLAGLLFSSALALCVGATMLLGRLKGFNNIIVYSLGVIPAFGFLPGLLEVERKYSVEKSFVPVAKTFFSAVKSLFLPFLVHGAVAYAAGVCTGYATVYYLTLAGVNFIFGYVLGIYVMFAAVIAMTLFYVPLISVSYRAGLREAYKNAVRLVFSGIFLNLPLLLLWCAVGAGAWALLSFSRVTPVLTACKIAALAVMCPLTLTYITVSAISRGMRERLGVFYDEKPEKSETAEDELKIVAEAQNQEDDYIFVNGKMIKNPNRISK